MTQPVKYAGHSEGLMASGQGRAVDHNDRYTEGAGCFYFCNCAVAACVFCNDPVDRVVTHQGGVTGDCEGPARDDDCVMRQWRRLFWWIDEAQHVMVLGGRCKARKVHPADREQYAFGGAGQRLDGCVHIRHDLPIVFRLALPGLARQRDQGDAGCSAGRDRVLAHLHCKRVGGINKMRNAIFAQVGRETLNPTKAADAVVDRLRPRAGNAASVRQRCCDAGRGDGACKVARLAGAAEDQEVLVHGR